jgi:indole-3-glycerol phosphate synthase
MDILEDIVKKKRVRLEEAKGKTRPEELRGRIRDIEAPRDFGGAIKRGASDTIRLIAEIKKASPSEGLIRAGFDPVAIASIYESCPVDAVSVLTEEDFFQGDLAYIAAVKKATAKPILRKDFIFDEYQLFEARAAGADAILLIAALLGRGQAAGLYALACELGMSVLFEVHDEEDLEKALYIDAAIIGINNRNLKTMTVDLDATFRLRKMIPEGRTVVSESGIRSRQDVLTLRQCGVDAMLIGTAFMKSTDICARVNALMRD